MVGPSAAAAAAAAALSRCRRHGAAGRRRRHGAGPPPAAGRAGAAGAAQRAAGAAGAERRAAAAAAGSAAWPAPAAAGAGAGRHVTGARRRRGGGQPLPERPVHQGAAPHGRHHPARARHDLHVRGAGHRLRRVLRALAGRHHGEAQHQQRCSRRHLHGRRWLGARAVHQRHRRVHRQERRRHRHHRGLCRVQHPVCDRDVRHLQSDGAGAHVVAALPRRLLLRRGAGDAHGVPAGRPGQLGRGADSVHVVHRLLHLHEVQRAHRAPGEDPPGRQAGQPGPQHRPPGRQREAPVHTEPAAAVVSLGRKLLV
ncbi:hypothetical protein FJT64_003854 [Amphibalanus amphitrite]|uniref:Uncharacterized protein n=1 Tax=Amphibalanus amphitrite TaxID=1232801 RepID=A0A6A4W515_AMPAM|nr:hypothetical protein FJT64_003854 [Amphibalanus amphitrite]